MALCKLFGVVIKMRKELARLNARIPQEEYDAFKSWCADHDMTMARALTGLIHNFNVRQSKADEQSVERLRNRLEQQAHSAVLGYKMFAPEA